MSRSRAVDHADLQPVRPDRHRRRGPGAIWPSNRDPAAGIRLREGLDQGELAWRRPIAEHDPEHAPQSGLRWVSTHTGAVPVIRAGGSRTGPDSGRKRGRTRASGWSSCPGSTRLTSVRSEYERNMRRMDANRSRAQGTGRGARGPGPAGRAGALRPLRRGTACPSATSAAPAASCSRPTCAAWPPYTWAEERCQHAVWHVRRPVRRPGSRCRRWPRPRWRSPSPPPSRKSSERGETDRIWRQRLERADYAADRARRQYQLAEPENRLVVRQLEEDWNRGPGRAAAPRRGLRPPSRRAGARALTAAERDEIRALAADLPARLERGDHDGRGPQAAAPAS